MATNMKMTKLFEGGRDAAAEAEREKRMIERRWTHYQKILETARVRQDERMALLGLSYEEIEAAISSGRLNRKGVEMFLGEVSGKGKGIGKLPGELPKLARLLENDGPSAPEDPDDKSAPRKTRVKFHL